MFFMLCFWHMARRKMSKRSIRNIQKSQRTYYVTLPIEIMQELGWQERQKVVVKKYGKGKVLIQDWK